MPAPPLPPQIEELGGRRFAFFPAILAIEPNDWIFQSATWLDVLVKNAQTGVDVWIPRRYLGPVSSARQPLIVSLVKELEFRDGRIIPWPAQVIELRVAVNERWRPPAAPRRPAPVLSIRMETDRRPHRRALAVVAATMACCILAAGVSRQTLRSPAGELHDDAYLRLTPRDDRGSIELRLGAPQRRSTSLQAGGLRFEALSYPARGFTLVLMGNSAARPRYLGALDRRGGLLHASRPAGEPILRGLHAFSK